MRTINIFKQLQPGLDPIPGKLFLGMLTTDGEGTAIPKDLWDVVGDVAYAHVGHTIVVQEHGQTVGSWTAS